MKRWPNFSVFALAVFAVGIASPMSASSTASRAATAVSYQSSSPFVTIRFDTANVNYESALFSAAKAAMDRNPSVTFEVVAVAPEALAAGGPGFARRHGDSVARSLTNMGIARNRIHVSQITSSDTRTVEVRVFAR